MSLDLYMSHPACQTCGHEPEKVYYNCTYNLAPMWYKIYPDDDNFVPIEGMTGREADPQILDALTLLEEFQEEFQALNPPNGWGTYETFVEFLGKVHEACIAFPDGVWEAYR